MTCPYCNAIVAVPTGAALGQRVDCARCGESFTLRSLEGVGGEAARDQRPSKRSASRRTATAIVLVMTAMAATALVFALWTRQTRRDRDPVPGPADGAAVLGYLPPDTNLLLGVSVADVLAKPEGKQLLNDLLRVGPAPVSLTSWTGLDLEEIEFAVLGFKTNDLFSGVLVVRAKQPIDTTEARAKLADAADHAETNQRPVVRFKSSLGAADWRLLDSRTVAVALARHLNDVPDAPARSLDNLPEEVRAILADRVDRAAPVWVAGHAEKWNETIAALPLTRLSPRSRDTVLTTRTFALWLLLDDPLALRAEVQTADEKSATELERLLRGEKLAEGLTLACQENWVSVQFKVGLERLRKALGR